MRYSAVLFDLDGTLLDTIDDLAGALNAARVMNGLPTQDLALIKSFIGNGRRRLIERSLTDDPGTFDDALADKLIADHIRYYNSHCMVTTKPFDGIEELIRRLRSDGLKICCITNKDDVPAQVLISHFFPDMFDYVAGSMAGVEFKPDPGTVLKCCDSIGVTPDRCVYIGDSEVDIQTAANAGMDCISVCWGYKPRGFLEQNGAANLCSNPVDLRRFIV